MPKSEKTTKTIKTIRVDADKCNGCRTCEVICAAAHAEPKYCSINPSLSRIKVITRRLDDVWLPVFAGEYTSAECAGRNKYLIDGKEYDECEFCRASCPSRGRFVEPDSGMPLKCDMCEGEEMPLCVEWCLNDVLIYEEREEEVEEQPPAPKELESGLEVLTQRFGFQAVIDTAFRMGKK